MNGIVIFVLPGQTAVCSVNLNPKVGLPTASGLLDMILQPLMFTVWNIYIRQ